MDVARIADAVSRLPRGGVDRNFFVTKARPAKLRSPPSRRRGSKRRLPRPLLRGHRSPPSRRRGSKRSSTRISSSPCRSPPSRRRGSKRRLPRPLLRGHRSPPSRRRGSKPHPRTVRPHRQPVASLAEAWIETSARRCCALWGLVASLAEAWIETTRKSRGSRSTVVASLAEAWIETPMSCGSRPAMRRRLPRGGVDRNAASRICDGHCPGRLPRGGVDRNSNSNAQHRNALVASLAEAWIETRNASGGSSTGRVASLAEAWIETRRSGWSSCRR